jgi:HCOMODA/2-hydroxy-3-carboxy-muconic semialdehyde decarboxylase
MKAEGGRTTRPTAAALQAPASGGAVAAELLRDLAAASRILAAQGVVDGFGHVSMRHPLAPDRYLMARSIAPALVTPGDIIEYDLDSNPCNAGGRGSFLERFIHGEIYKARPDIMSVVHSHSPSVIPFGLVGVAMRAMFHNAAFIAAGVPVFDIREKFGATDMLVSDGAKGVALATAMGGRDVVLMRAHGSVACGPTLQTAVFRAVYTEVNARIQHWAAALGGGGPIAALDGEEGRLADVPNRTAGTRAWDLWRAQVRSQVNW